MPKAARAKQKQSAITGDATLPAIHEAKEAGKKKHQNASNTTEKYDGHVKCGREWLFGHFKSKDLDAQATQAGDVDTSIGGKEESVYDDLAFRQAFESQPNQHSDKALALYLSYKCFHQNLGQSTAEGSHAAFKKLWENS
jgi:hypothetical protein